MEVFSAMNRLLACRVHQNREKQGARAKGLRDQLLQEDSEGVHTMPECIVATSAVSGRGLKALSEAVCLHTLDT